MTSQKMPRYTPTQQKPVFEIFCEKSNEKKNVQKRRLPEMSHRQEDKATDKKTNDMDDSAT
jgi:hypothetical protein